MDANRLKSSVNCEPDTSDTKEENEGKEGVREGARQDRVGEKRKKQKEEGPEPRGSLQSCGPNYVAMSKSFEGSPGWGGGLYGAL